MEIQAPECLKKALYVPNKLMFGAGPSNVSPRVLHALSQPVFGPICQEMYSMLDDIAEGLRYLFQTKNPATFALTNSGHGGMEAAISNLIEPGDSVLIAVTGFWSERAFIMAQRYGGVVHRMDSKPGCNFTLKELEEAIVKHKPVLLFIVQGESSSGVYQPLEGLAPICHKYNCLLAVDCVVSCGGVPILVDKWEIDVAFTGSQKALGVPPGLAPITINQRALDRINNRKTTIPGFYLDLKLQGVYWGSFGNTNRMFHYTVSSNLLYALRETLAMIVEEGLENLYARHERIVNEFRAGIKQLGLEFFVKDPSMRLTTVTTVMLPSDVVMTDVLQYCMDKYRIEFAAGLGPTAGKALRIGLMGYNAKSENVKLALTALKESISACRNMKNGKK